MFSVNLKLFYHFNTVFMLLHSFTILLDICSRFVHHDQFEECTQKCRRQERVAIELLYLEYP